MLVLSGASYAGAAQPQPGEPQGSSAPASVSETSREPVVDNQPQLHDHGEEGADTATDPSDTPSEPDSAESPATAADSESSEPAAAPVEVVSKTLPQGRTRHRYSARLQAAGGTAPYTWELTSGALAPGLRLSETGAVTGTPTKHRVFALTVQVTDADDASASRRFELKVVLATPAITTKSLPAGKFRHAYSATLRATDGTPGYTWSRTGGSLPTGLKLARSGRISGTPSRVGTWSFTVKVTDSKGKYATRALRIKTSASMDRAVSTVSASVLRYSYRPGCPVGPPKLRRIALNQWGFAGQPYRGEIIVRSSVVTEVTRVFGKSFGAKFPVRKMRRVESYKGSDERSMADDNTSAFNCRHVTGNPTRLSQHSYGIAIDINPFENPYVTSSRVYPPGSSGYLKRSPYRKGMILRGSVFAKAFAAEKWYWGARWRHPDYQHFSENGG
jgi:hypothetical protein